MRSRHANSECAFTLIELLAVVAIIALLIGILIPSLSKARDQGKNASTRGTLKAIESGLEMFRSENADEYRVTGGYPRSDAGDDPTESGTQDIFGCQWLVRHLMGKDFRGFAPRRLAPANLQNRGAADEQIKWYADGPDGRPMVQRVGPYMNPDGVKVVAVSKVKGAPSSLPGMDAKAMEQPVILDAFDQPILYYAANQHVAKQANAPVATYDGSEPGIYNFHDNSVFTGACRGNTCSFPPWDLGGGQHHAIQDFGPNDPPKATNIDDKKDTFPYFILNKGVYASTNRRSAMPVRKDSFLLMSAGRDANFGTSDDVNNLER
ncbi:MAG: hypothetical protein CHACPFDD_00761 [Phycisphaerae bacterium]|nr:hypothetical protein [Phycisphaerae bacterium]